MVLDHGDVNTFEAGEMEAVYTRRSKGANRSSLVRFTFVYAVKHRYELSHYSLLPEERLAENQPKPLML